MKIGICQEYDRCSLARNSVMQEIEEHSPFYCRECGNLLQEALVSNSPGDSFQHPQETTELQNHTQNQSLATPEHPLQRMDKQERKSAIRLVPLWFKLLILFIFSTIGVVVLVFFLMTEPPTTIIPDPPKPPPVIARIIDSIPDTLVQFDNTKEFSFRELLGPFSTSVPVDTFLIRVIESNGIVYDTLDQFVHTTVFSYTIIPKTQNANIALRVLPIHKGVQGDPILIERNFEAKPPVVVVERFIRANRRNQRFNLPTGNHFLTIPQQTLSADQQQPYEIRWSLNRARTSREIDQTSIPVSGVGFIPEFELIFFEEPENAQVVFNISPSKAGFTSVNSAFFIEIKGTPCEPDNIVNSFNDNIEAVANSLRDELMGSLLIRDHEDRAVYLSQAKSYLRQLANVKVEVEGFITLDDFINSDFSRVPDITFDKNVCNKIYRMRVTPK